MRAEVEWRQWVSKCSARWLSIRHPAWDRPQCRPVVFEISREREAVSTIEK